MRSLLTFHIITVFFCAVPRICRAQNDSVLRASETTMRPLQKIYIHYDKSTYFPGDTVWFKAYLFTGNNRSTTSKNFYLDLVTFKGKVIGRFTAPIYESTASGNIVLPADTSASGYFCRAYTTASLNDDPDYLYTQALSVAGLNKKLPAPYNFTMVHFYPEGGEWVQNLPAVIAFKATDITGLPVYATGVIQNGKDTVARFTTAHDGMGVFSLTAKPNESYFAVWTDAKGERINGKFLTPKAEGISLHITDTKAGRKFQVFRSKNAEQTDRDLSLIAYANGEVVYEAKLDLSVSEMVSGMLPFKQLKSGIVRISVLNQDKKPLAERIVFVNNHDYSFNADTMLSLTNIKRSLNQITLAINDTVRSNLSIAVTDANVDSSAPYADNIISHFLLTGELKGKILNPYYYFANKTDSAAYYLDMVMLTNGWRRYNWYKLPAGTAREQNYLSLNGKLTGLSSSAFSSGPAVNIILQTRDSSSALLPTNIDKAGTFHKDGIIFYGDAKLFFKFPDKNLRSATFKAAVNNGLLDTLRLPAPLAWRALTDANPDPVYIRLSPEQKAYFFSRKTKQLQEVLITGKKETAIEKLDKEFAGGLFSGGSNYKNIDFREEKIKRNYPSIFQYLQANIPGLVVQNEGSIYPYATWRTGIGGPLPVTFYLNNFKSSPSDLSRINIEEFEYVKIYDPDETSIFGVPGGVVSVYTKKGTGLSMSTDNRVTATVSGYSPLVEFYSPDYATIVNTKPDLRTTLYWNPNIILDKAHPQQVIKFYNNDVTRKFKIVLQGINFDGKLVYMEKVL